MTNCARVFVALCLISTLSSPVWCAPWAGLTPTTSHYLMPVPESAEFKAGRLPFRRSFTVAARAASHDKRLEGAIDRALRRLEGRTGLTLSRAPASSESDAALLIECAGPGLQVQSIDED